MTSNTVVLITGPNRGIGKGLFAHYLSQPNHTVIAAVRNPEDVRAKALLDLPKGTGSTPILVKIDSASLTDAESAIKELQTTHGITVLDLVIANAGINKLLPPIREAKPSDMVEHFNINAVAVVLLYQAVLPLFKDAKEPKFVPISTYAATIAEMEVVTLDNGVYGPSKSALNWITRKIHFENTGLISFPIHPGLVKTDMAMAITGDPEFAEWLEKQGITVEQSVAGLTKVISEATRESTSGKFMSYDGNTIQW